MDPIEAKFRDVERKLDAAMKVAASSFHDCGMSVEDTSWRSYHNRVEHLMWEYTLKKEWALGSGNRSC